MIAAHAAAALCPRCNRPVRTGVQLQAAAADLEDLVLRLDPLRESPAPDDQELHAAAACLLRHYALELRMELAAEHLDCHATGLDSVVLDHALSRAAECAARARATLQ